jgi:hypothetical protein
MEAKVEGVAKEIADAAKEMQELLLGYARKGDGVAPPPVFERTG